MTSLLEERYRRALRILPAAYRRAWEEDMVATFLEAAHAAAPDDPEGVEISSPSRAELISIATLSVRLRLGGAGAAPRSFAWGEAARRIALIGLLVYASGALVGVLIRFWIAGRLPGVAVPADALQVNFVNQWQALRELTGLLWLPAYLSLLYGHWRAARAVALVAFAPDLVSAVVRLATGDTFLLSGSYWVLFSTLPMLALAAFHGTAPPVRPRPWLAALPVGILVTFAGLLLSQVDLAPEAPALELAGWPGLWCAALAGAAIVHLVRPGGRGGGLPWTLALAVLAVALLGLRVTTLVDHLSFAAATPQRSTLVAIAIGQSVAMLAAGTALAVLAARWLRRLPVPPQRPGVGVVREVPKVK